MNFLEYVGGFEGIIAFEDDVVYQRILERVLREIDLTIFTTLAESQEFFLKGTCELVILDIHLPDASGGEAVEQLRVWGSGLTIIAHTCDELHDIKNIGVNGYLPKPLTKQSEVIFI